MGIEDLKQNIETEKKILREIISFTTTIQRSQIVPINPEERTLMLKSLKSLIEQFKILNNSIPGIINSISPYKSLQQQPEKVENLVKISIPTSAISVSGLSVTLEKKDKSKFLEELSLTESTLRRLKRGTKIKKQEYEEFKQAGAYARISNRFFKTYSDKYLDNGYFKSLNADLRKANMSYLVVTYVSMIFFTTFLSIFFTIFAFLGLYLFFPDSILYISLVFLTPVFVFLGLYVYPGLEGKSIASRIDQEIPFVTIHMSAIAGSGIEPTQVFKIIALGEEYPYTRTELKKIINQVNLYGYDLVTALKNTSRETSSRKLAELLNGMASSISGGSQLPEFLDKRAETLLFEYRLEKERYTKTTETLMDVYISIMIAAPMIMTLLLVLISISKISVGLTMDALTILIISVVALINIVFLVFLRLSKGEI